MSYEQIITTIRASLFDVIAVAITCTLLFISLEPVVGRTQATDTFTVTQTITGAIAFAQNANDVTMDGAIDGLTGGTAYGTTTVRVTTNNATGFNMTIDFSSTTAMRRDGAAENQEILNYVNSTSTDTYASGFDTTQPGAQFAFTVDASSTADISDVFTNTGSLCGTSNNGSFTAYTCWRGASSTDETFETELISTSGPTPSSGSTSTVMFRVTVPPNPVPAVPNGTFVATATLTATDN